MKLDSTVLEGGNSYTLRVSNAAQGRDDRYGEVEISAGLRLDTGGGLEVTTGTVKWFNNAKGYGFAVPESGGDDIFVHYSSIQMDGYRTLRAGQPISFDIKEGPKGLHAVNIRVHGEPTVAEAGNGQSGDSPPRGRSPH